MTESSDALSLVEVVNFHKMREYASLHSIFQVHWARFVIQLSMLKVEETENYFHIFQLTLFFLHILIVRAAAMTTFLWRRWEWKWTRELIPCEEKYLHNSFKGLKARNNELLAFYIPPGRIWLRRKWDCSLPGNHTRRYHPSRTVTPPQKSKHTK